MFNVCKNGVKLPAESDGVIDWMTMLLLDYIGKELRQRVRGVAHGAP